MLPHQSSTILSTCLAQARLGSLALLSNRAARCRRQGMRPTAPLPPAVPVRCPCLCAPSAGLLYVCINPHEFIMGSVIRLQSSAYSTINCCAGEDSDGSGQRASRRRCSDPWDAHRNQPARRRSSSDGSDGSSSSRPARQRSAQRPRTRAHSCADGCASAASSPRCAAHKRGSRWWCYAASRCRRASRLQRRAGAWRERCSRRGG